MSGWQRFGMDVTGLTGARLRLLTDLPTNGVAPADLPHGTTDVTAIDDDVGVYLCIRVHPVDDPHTIASVSYEQLAIYDDQPALHDHVRHRLRHDATGLTGTRMRMTTTPTTRIIGDVGDSQRNPVGYTDVICLDDTPTAARTLRVHPIDAPESIAVVRCDQLTIYATPRDHSKRGLEHDGNWTAQPQ